MSIMVVFLMTSCKTSEQTTKKTTTKYSVETDESGEYVSLLTDKTFKRGFKVWGLGLPIYGDDIELYGGDYEKETNLFYYLSYSHLCLWTGRQRAKPADDF